MDAKPCCNASVRSGRSTWFWWKLIAAGVGLVLLGSGAFAVWKRIRIQRTLSLLLEGHEFRNLERTPGKLVEIKACVPILIGLHQRAVRETQGLTDGELLARGSYAKVVERMRYWNALQYAEGLTGDPRAREYIRRHVRSREVWWSEWPYASNPNAPARWRRNENRNALPTGSNEN